MSKLQFIEQDIGHFIVAGNLTFATIGKDTLKSMMSLTSAREITLDLKQVGLTDSAGLALMIEWLKYARSKRTHTVFKNIPEQLRNLAKLSGLDKIGPLANSIDSEN